MQKIKKILPLGLLLLPFLASAKQISDVINDLKGIINAIIPLLISIAVLTLIWGIVKFVTSAGDEEKRKEGKDLMIYGIIGLFIMVSIWGLVGVLVSTFGLGEGSAPDLPTYLP